VERAILQYPRRTGYLVDTSEFHLIKERVAVAMHVANPASSPNHEKKKEQ
jgi:hypothetical protein